MPSLQDQVNQETVETKVLPTQSSKRDAVRVRLSARIQRLRDIHRLGIPYFRNRDIITYIEDGVKRVNEFKERPAYKQAWQSNLAGSTIRDKLVGILSKLSSQAMEAQVISTKELSAKASFQERVAQSLLKAAAKKNDDDYALVLEMWEAMNKGTVVGFEGWKMGERTIREVVSYDIDGTVKTKERIIKEWNDVIGMIWALEDVYFSNLYVDHVQKMPEVALRQKMKFDDFQIEFGKFPDADLVQPASNIRALEDQTIFRISEDLEADEVEVWRWFNKDTDEYVLMANDIWINPMSDDTVQPLIWNHKKLPIWSARFELFAANFIYGRSFPDKLMSNSDYEDSILDSVLDRLTLALRAPLVAPHGTTSLTENYLTPQNVIEFPAGSDPPRTLDIKEPGNVSFQILELLQRRMEAQSLSSESTGGGGVKNKTATQVAIEQEAALELVSLFLKFMEFGIRDKNRLRMSNIFQFYSLPIHNKDKEIKFRKVILRDEKLANGKVGSREVSIVSKINQSRLEQENDLIPGETEKIEVTPSFIRDFGFESDIIIVPSSSIKINKATRQALEVLWQRTSNELYPDQLNREEGFNDLARAFDKVPSNVKVKSGEEGAQAQEGLTPEVGARNRNIPTEPSIEKLLTP